ncbi:MAG TPA: glycosyltransferase [Tepidisphaeraceae bacterium]|jgi:glycosyltransferase involved in cell wall biosynthesis
MSELGVVAIGRNEGARLEQCLRSVCGRGHAVVYVDSGSTDGSVELARKWGADVVELDMSIPFTAARARNAGFELLQRLAPDTRFVQFVDGDCEVVNGWLALAERTMNDNVNLGVVCGRRRERFPDRSIYNLLCDLEWDTPIGEAKACGGDAAMRVRALTQVDGFNETIIAGEEPELCVRLRARNWTILRIDAEMTLHDAAMTRFGQWWRRNIRAGHAYAEGAAMHGAPPERHWVREVRSNWLWGLATPFVALAAAWPTYGWSLGLLAGYPLLMFRVRRGARRRMSGRFASIFAFFIVLGKIPQALGQLKYHRNRLLGRRARIIEYKNAETHTA